ncbi:MAG: beta-lactamase family protein [Deltaproteobacteria bacterium]|nr:beta-lactamase family protein [Deltaproteobacteria bacterium]
MGVEVGVKRWEIRGLTSKRVRVFDPDEVTARGAPEADPGSVGLGRDDVESIWSAVVDFYKTGFHPALGLCIRRRGEVILDRTIGQGTPLVRATPKTLFNFFSGSKAVTAMLIHLLAERDQLHVDEPVATFIPEFARNRKQRITIRDLLTHRAGIPETPAQVADLDMLQDPQRILEMLYELEPTYSGIREFLRREISEPLGTSHFNYGVPEERLDEVAIDACTGPKLIWPLKDIFEKALGVSIEELIDISNDPRFRTGIIPSANLIATPDDICRFFELLVAGGTFEGTRVFAEDTVRRATELQTAGQIDRMLLLPVSYSMGFMLGTEPVGLYGIRCGKAFGHVGLSNILAWADPERDIAVALLNSGKPFVAVDTYHWLNIVRLISTRIPRDGSKRFVI